MKFIFKFTNPDQVVSVLQLCRKQSGIAPADEVVRTFGKCPVHVGSEVLDLL